MYNILIKYNDSKKLWQLYGTTTSATSSEETFVPFETDDLEKLKTEFKKIKGQNDFGNGRYVRNILEQAQMNQATRLMKKNIDQLTAKDVSMFTAEDIELSVTEKKTIRRIGF